MELTGKIIAILPAQGGVSQRTGNPWKSQDYVIETQEIYPKKCCFSVFGDEKIQQMNIQLGETLTVSLDINANEYQGKWYNQVRAWKVERMAQAQQANAAQGCQPYYPNQQPAQAQAPQQTAYAPQQTPQPQPQAPMQQPAAAEEQSLPF